jgi:hypothetical protein
VRLSIAEQRIVRLWRLIGYGHIDTLYVRDGVPSHLVGERPIECRIDPVKGDARGFEPFEVADSEQEVDLHAHEERLLRLMRSIQQGFLRITIKDGLPVSWYYYPDLPTRVELRHDGVEQLMLNTK